MWWIAEVAVRRPQCGELKDAEAEPPSPSAGRSQPMSLKKGSRLVVVVDGFASGAEASCGQRASWTACGLGPAHGP